MKKTLTIAVLFVILVTLVLTGVKAVTGATLADEIYKKLSSYGMSSSDKVRIERHVKDITEEKANVILSKVDEAVQVMERDNVTDFRKLSSESKSEIQTLAQEAANTIGYSLTFENGSVKVYDNEGKLVETVSMANNGSLAYTGNSSVILVASSIAVIALATIVVAKTKFAKVGA